MNACKSLWLASVSFESSLSLEDRTSYVALVAVVSGGLNQLAAAVRMAAVPRMKPLADKTWDKILKALDVGGSEVVSSAMLFHDTGKLRKALRKGSLTRNTD